MVHHQIKILQSVASSIAEGGRGTMGTPNPLQPPKSLKLYEFEGSPFCRRVREVMTLLNLDYEVYPCPKGGKRYREVVQQLGGRQMFPFFIDENTGEQLYHSKKIIQHLFQHYSAKGEVPKAYAHYPNIPFVALTGTILNGARGVWVKKNIIDRPAPEKLLELWGFEASPFTRVVRAVLAELELPFIFHNVAKERWQDIGPAVLRLKAGPYKPIAGGKRDQLIKVIAHPEHKIQVPYLVDPNTNTQMFESADIVKYLQKQYG